MPELPEVEVVRQGLEQLLLGRQIKAFRFSNRRLRLTMPRSKLQHLALNQTVNQVRRRAKYLIVELSNQAAIIIHLGMTGRLGLFPATAKGAKHDHLRILLDSNDELRFNDCRRFGSIQVVTSTDHETELFKHLGPEPFSDQFSSDYLFAKSRRKSQPIKNFLMDNRVVVGIGNIYASEILYKSRISPLQETKKIPIANWHTIVKNCRSVLQSAIAAGGTTFSDFLGSDGKKGYFQIELEVYGRAGQECRRCGGIIKKIRMAGRTSFWCGDCQQ